MGGEYGSDVRVESGDQGERGHDEEGGERGHGGDVEGLSS